MENIYTGCRIKGTLILTNSSTTTARQDSPGVMFFSHQRQANTHNVDIITFIIKHPITYCRVIKINW